MTPSLAILLDKITEPPPIDRKLERQFRADAPSKDIPCVVPGCPHLFKRSTQYSHFVIHFAQHHRRGK